MAQGKGNPLSGGSRIYIDGLQYSAETGTANYGTGGGPGEAERMIFGFTERIDDVDSSGNSWRPGTEFVVWSGYGTDSVEESL